MDGEAKKLEVLCQEPRKNDKTKAAGLKVYSDLGEERLDRLSSEALGEMIRGACGENEI